MGVVEHYLVLAQQPIAYQPEQSRPYKGPDGS
jgi:hypothetical protein